jgi:hypothetical protein
MQWYTSRDVILCHGVQSVGLVVETFDVVVVNVELDVRCGCVCNLELMIMAAGQYIVDEYWSLMAGLNAYCRFQICLAKHFIPYRCLDGTILVESCSEHARSTLWLHSV